MFRTVLVCAVALSVAFLFHPAARAADALPKFTEEREAAALHFVRKHCADLIPLLDELKKTRKR